MSGCGCGGAVAPAAGQKKDCGCGCGGEASQATSFVRPSFFGGMLLTEDDLQAAVDYERAKRRLTNRYVVGDGVVCGLDVTCHPCDPRKVSVSPGYAIDCCGDDILVSCAEEVDIINLARAVRQKTGKDCGEPCDEHGSADYHLYLRYVETPSDPVAPYAQDDCATGDCEFSRVREGYAFELRCDPPDTPASLVEVLDDCLPDEEERRQAERGIAEAGAAAAAYARVAAVVAAGEQPIPRAPTKAEFDSIASAPVALDKAVALVNRALVVLAFDADDAAPSPGINADRRALIRDGAAELATRLRSSDELKTRPPEEIARLESVLELAEARADLSTLGVEGRAWLAEGLTPEAAQHMYSTGGELVRTKVLGKLTTGCEAYRKLSAMSFGKLSSTSPADAAILARMYGETVGACACSAFNPPCPACADDAVAIAKVHVENCEVTDVCALERRWLPTPRALSYWFPIVEMFRRNLADYCCAPDGERRSPVSATESEVLEAVDMFQRAFSRLGVKA
jgi:hypothetical protein